MRKSKSIYVWDNVENILQIIESQIDFNSHITYLYDQKYCPKEDTDRSITSENCIKDIKYEETIRYWGCV